MESVRPIDLYLNGNIKNVIQAKSVRDESGGMYPVYYMEGESSLRVSTSVVSLLRDEGDLHRNEGFDIPSYVTSLRKPSRSDENRYSASELIQDVLGLIPSYVRNVLPYSTRQKILSLITNDEGGDSSPSRWRRPWDTIDKRVQRLRPFEEVGINSKKQEKIFDRSLSDPNALAIKTAHYIETFVHKIEKRFPNHEHIILTGGKDSQLISLVDKKSDKWHLFSADPNYRIVEKFVDRNRLKVKNIFRTDNKNRENRRDVQKKLLCSDLISDIRHVRWVKEIEQISRRLGSPCIIWKGAGGGEILQYRPGLDFPETYVNRVPSMQGMSNQINSNFTNCPNITPYYSPMLWDNVFKHYDPTMMSEGMDVRPEIGEILNGGPVWWPDENPKPSPYEYSLTLDPVELFISGLYEKSKIQKMYFGDNDE